MAKEKEKLIHRDRRKIVFFFFSKILVCMLQSI
jgi:hypothetical protein